MRWYRVLLSVSLFAATLLAWNVTTARADGEITHNGPAFLAVAVDSQDFELPLNEEGFPTGGGTVNLIGFTTMPSRRARWSHVVNIRP